MKAAVLSIYASLLSVLYFVNNMSICLNSISGTLFSVSYGRSGNGSHITSNANYTMVNTTWEVCFQGPDKTVITEHHRVNKKIHITSMFVSLQKISLKFASVRAEWQEYSATRDERAGVAQKKHKQVYNNRWYYSHQFVYEDFFCCSVKLTIYCRNCWIYKNIQSLFKYLEVY